MKGWQKVSIFVIAVIAFMVIAGAANGGTEHTRGGRAVQEVAPTPAAPVPTNPEIIQLIDDTNTLVKKTVDLCSEIHAGGVFVEVDERVQCKKLGVKVLKVCDIAKQYGAKVENCEKYREDLEFLASL